MSRPKLKQEDKKIKVSITINRETNQKLEKITNNKSSFIEKLIINFIDNEN
jgi:hypothetical protein